MSERSEFPQDHTLNGASPAGGAQGPHYSQEERPTKKRGRGCLWMVLGVLLIIVLLVVGAVALFNTGAGKATHKVTYKVTGNTTVDVTYSTDTNASSVGENATTLPWSKTINVSGRTTGMKVNVANPTNRNETVTCEIDVDGKKVMTALASGTVAGMGCTAP